MKVGDVVRLKGGSPGLTVVAEHGDETEVAWFPITGISSEGNILTGQPMRSRFPTAALELVPDEENDNTGETLSS